MLCVDWFYSPFICSDRRMTGRVWKDEKSHSAISLPVVSLSSPSMAHGYQVSAIESLLTTTHFFLRWEKCTYIKSCARIPSFCPSLSEPLEFFFLLLSFGNVTYLECNPFSSFELRAIPARVIGPISVYTGRKQLLKQELWKDPVRAIIWQTFRLSVREQRRLSNNVLIDQSKENAKV